MTQTPLPHRWGETPGNLTRPEPAQRWGPGPWLGRLRVNHHPQRSPGGSAPLLWTWSAVAMYTTLGTPDWTYGTRHGKVLCGHVEVSGGTGLCSEPTGWPR